MLNSNFAYYPDQWIISLVSASQNATLIVSICYTKITINARYVVFSVHKKTFSPQTNILLRKIAGEEIDPCLLICDVIGWPQFMTL